MKGFLLSIALFVLAQITVAQTSYVWNGGTSTAWNTPANWTPNGTPGAADNVTIVTGGNNCILPSSISIVNLTITTGVLNLGTNTLTVTGVLSATGGQCNNGTLSATGATQTFSGTNFGASINVNPSATNDVYFNGSTFGGSVTVIRNNAGNIQSTGNNIFNGVTSITNAGSGYLLLTNNAAKPDAFNAALTLNTSNTGALYVAYTGSVTLAANVTINNTSGNGNIQLGRAGAGGVTLNNGITITTGSFAGATLLLQNFTQVGSTALNLSPGANGGVSLYSATINGNLTVSAGDVYTRNSTFAGTVNLTKLTGTNSNNMSGGNTFGSTVTINYTSTSGNGYWGFAGGTADTYNGDVFVNNNSLDRILWGVGGPSISSFNGNVTLTQIGSSVGISTGWSASTGCTLANGKTISIGGAGFSVGYLYLQGLTQVGSTAINLTLTGTAALTVGTAQASGPVTIGGSFTVNAPDVYFRGGTFNGAVTITKTGTGSDHNNGNLNTFNSTCTINNQGSAGYFMLGYNSADAFNDNITVTSTAAGAVNLGWSGGTGTPTLAAGKTVLIGGAGFSTGSLYFGTFTQNGNAAMNLDMGAASAATITFDNHTVIGGNLTTQSSSIYYNNSTFNGTVNSIKNGAANDNSVGGNTFGSTTTITNNGSGQILLGNGSADIFNGTTTFNDNGSYRFYYAYSHAGQTTTFASDLILNGAKTGGVDGWTFLMAEGNNTNISYGGNVTYNISGSLQSNTRILNGTGGTATYAGNLTINLSNTNAPTVIQMGVSGTSTYNGNIVVTNSGGASGITFNANATSSSTLANAKTITIGAAGFSAGALNLYRFTQTGGTAQSLTLTGTANLTVGPTSAFGGNVTFTSPTLFLNGCTYSGTSSFTKNGTTNDASTGGNTFTGVSTIINSGSGIMYMANGAATPDNFVTDLTATNSGSGSLYLAHTAPGNTFGGNITFNNTASGTTTNIGIAYNAGSSAAITGNFNISNTGSGTTSNDINIANGGTVTTTGTTSIINNGSGAGHSRVFINEGTASAATTFGGDVTMSNISAAAGDVYFRNLRGVLTFNGNLIVNNTATTASQWNGFYFTWVGWTGTETLAAGKTITVGVTGFSTGRLQLINFTQIGNTPQTLTLTGSANLTVGPTSAFGGNVTFVAPTMFLNGCTYSGTSSFTKNGSTNDASNGGNTFTGVSTVTNSGSGIMYLANVAASPDNFVTDVTATNNGSGSLYLANTAVGNTFGGNLIFNNTASGVNTNIVICNNTNSTATIDGNLTITNAATGTGNNFAYVGNNGSCNIIGNVTINNTSSGTNSGIYIEQGPASSSVTIGGNLSITNTGSATTANDANISGSVGTTTITGTTTIINNGSGGGHSRVFINEGSALSSTTFGGDATFSNISAAAGDVYFRNLRGAISFNGNLVVSNTATTASGNNGFYFTWTGWTGTETLAAGKTITVGAAGFSTGRLQLMNFTQIGGTAQSLTLTGTTTTLQFGPNSAFGGNVTSVSPGLLFNGCTFSGTATCTKNGSSNDGSIGNNIFNGTAIITNSGSGYLQFGNGNADQFNAAATFNNTSSVNGTGIYVADNSANNIFGGVTTFNNTPTNANSLISVSRLSAGTTFNNNIVVTSTFGQGVQFCGGNVTATATLSAGNTITIGGGGFSAGTLLLKQFTQVGATAQSLTLTGTGNLTFGPTSAFGGNVTSISPSLLFNGCTFSGTTTCTKNGSTNDWGIGNNIFTGVSTITNSGSGYLAFGNGNRDQWITDVTFNNTGSNIIYAAANAANNTFGGNVILNNVGSTGNNNGIYFCNNANATASITGNLTITNNPTSGTTNGIRICDGNTTSFSVGGTTSITNVNNNTSNYIRFGAGTGSTCTFTGDVTVNNNGTTASANAVYFSYTGSSTFNGNITLNSTGGAGVVFGNSGGTSTQANNKTINTSTFTGGPLYLRNFVQSGPTTGNTSNVSITGVNQLLTFNGSSFYDNVTGSSQEITATTSTFRGTTALTKVSGNANDNFAGGNTFNGTTTITNQSTFVLGMANGTADAYNGNVTFVQSGTGLLNPSYNANCTYAGNITITSPAGVAMTFGSGGGTSTMNGSSGGQTINLTTGLTPVFTRFTMNHTGTGVTLNTPINVSNSLTMTNGLLNTTAANILTMLNASTASALTSASTSYINGPMRFQKASTNGTSLNFPIGKGSDCRPVILTVNHGASATLYNYTAELFNADPWVAMNSGAPYVATNMPQTVDTISKVHYWNIARTDAAAVSQPNANLSGNQQITLYFDVNDQVYQGGSLTIVKNTSATPAAWIDIGGSCALGNFSTPQVGSVTSTSSPSAFNSFSSFTLGSKADFGWNPLPIELLYFDAKPVNNTVDLTWSTSTETNNKFFTIEKSKNGVDFEFLQNINSEALNGNSTTTLNYRTYDLNPYTGTNYYRLKQTDYNGNYKYANIARVDFDKKSFVSVFPNPASNSLFINVSNDYDKASVKFMDALGREVLSQNINASNINTINTEALSPGIYYVVVDNGSGEANKTKITIQK